MNRKWTINNEVCTQVPLLYDARGSVNEPANAGARAAHLTHVDAQCDEIHSYSMDISVLKTLE